jgi:hypothetical protein
MNRQQTESWETGLHAELGLRPYPTNDAVRARIEQARATRNAAVDHAVRLVVQAAVDIARLVVGSVLRSASRERGAVYTD